MLLTGPFAMLSMPSFDFHLPPCTEGFLIHLSPLWQLPLRQLPLFPSVTHFMPLGVPQLTAHNWQKMKKQIPYMSLPTIKFIGKKQMVFFFPIILKKYDFREHVKQFHKKLIFW